ncbi:iron chelate uptake ABC transporter family permease subunit, partial [Rhizobium leguminosarum]|uniref:iron chelate uptake ABC transporter family permease subunit n=1 Tax=Rhizobium leguminosarum TaxID=384 RepID=UPI003F9DCC5C
NGKRHPDLRPGGLGEAAHRPEDDVRQRLFGGEILQEGERRIRLETMLIVSLLAAVPVSLVGTIGFVGLVGPHIARM